MSRMRHLLVSLLTALLVALAFPVSGSAQTLEDLYARLDPPPATEAEFAAISQAIEDLKLEHRFAFCVQEAIADAECRDLIRALWDTRDRGRELYLMTISIMFRYEGGSARHDEWLERCMRLHPDFIAETECWQELNAYMEALIDRHAPGSVIFNDAGEVLYPVPDR